MNSGIFMKAKKAFTLAEVLVTLMIIGVIAGLTIPNLLQSTRQKEYFVAYKKALSVSSQALERQIVDYNYTTLNNGRGDANAKQNFIEFSKYFNIAKTCFNNDNRSCWNGEGELLYANSQPTPAEVAFVDTSGVVWSLYANTENIFLVDTNGMKRPNEYGKDRWYFVPVNKDGIREGTTGPNGKAVTMSPYNPLNDTTGGTLKDITTYSTAWCQHPPCKIMSALSD